MFTSNQFLNLLCLLSVVSGLDTPSPRTISSPLNSQPTNPPSLLPRQNLPQLPGGGGNAPAASGSGNASIPISVPQTAAIGGLSYTQPAATAGASYYKIMPSNPITFGWNFTSLFVSPSSLTFQAYCTANSFTYPVGPATGIPGSQTQIIWDPYAYAQSPGAIPFAQASYTLRVFDERGPSAIASGGYFSGQNSLVVFAMYSPAAYTPLAGGWTCSACKSLGVRLEGGGNVLVMMSVMLAAVLIGGASVLQQ